MVTPCLMIPNPDQARQNVGPNLNQKCLTKELFEKVNFEFFLENEKKSFQSNPHTNQRENCSITILECL